MGIAIGSKIKQLRKTYDCIQENMAQALGVTPQAISRWENDTGYPDIEIIPSIANYFGVTIDTLFGYDSDRNLKIKEILEHVDELEKMGADPKNTLDYMRLAATEFPASDKITIRLANTLMRCGWTFYGAVQLTTDDENGNIITHPDYEHNRGNQYWQEALKIYENLIANTCDSDIREEAVCNAILIYWEFGNNDSIIKLAAKAPHIKASREMILSYCETANYTGEAIMALASALSERILTPCRFESKEQSICECEMMIALYEFIFHDGNFGKYHEDMCDMYGRLTHCFWRAGKKDKAFEALVKAKEHNEKFLSLLNTDTYTYTSLYTKGIVSDTAKWAPGKSPTFADMFWIYDESCPGISDDPRYLEIVGESQKNSAHD